MSHFRAALAALLLASCMASPSSAAPVEARRYPVLAARDPEWPPFIARQLISGPDWSDHHVYPENARQQEQEGVVAFVLLVGTDGLPRSCAILQSSGYAELDDGTCERGMTIRLVPARDAQGRAVPSTHGVRVTWMLNDPMPMAPGRLTIILTLRLGQVVDCRATPEGAVPDGWLRPACSLITYERRQFLDDDLPSARKAVVTVTLRPAGDTSVWAAPAGREIARRHTEFALQDDSAIRDCRVTVDRGFGPQRNLYVGSCGHFLSHVWLHPAATGAHPDRGTAEIGVWVQP